MHGNGASHSLTLFARLRVDSQLATLAFHPNWILHRRARRRLWSTPKQPGTPTLPSTSGAGQERHPAQQR